MGIDTVTVSRHFDPETLREIIGERELYFWGARHGYSMCRVFERLGFLPKGFIDSSRALAGSTVLGYPVRMPDEVIPAEKESVFIVITSSFFADEIAGCCREYGLEENRDFVPFNRIQKYDYQVDVSGICNLRCVSCPRGNMAWQPDAGFMTAAEFEKALDKILEEDPFTGVITLYNWGEPLLNPELAEILRVMNRRGVLAALSSNLNVSHDFSGVIREKPMWFRVSVSGFEESYETTHTGGKWDVLLRNMLLLKQWRRRYHPEMIVEVFYHIYNHNNGDDFTRMRGLCEELGFTFRYRHAALAPLDNVRAVINGEKVSEAVSKTLDLQILPVAEAVRLAGMQRDRECPYERCLWITWDMKVAQCMEWYADGALLVPRSFLETSLEEIASARKGNPFCRACRNEALHRCYVVYGDEKLIHLRRSVEV